jgi:uncharacterized membrane protein
MNTKPTDVVTEYLHEVDLRLSGLPVLQRRELLADLAAHVATERTERNIQTEGELIEILERLGSPEVVAAAAYEEAGAHPPVPTARRRRPKALYWLFGVIAGLVVLIVLLLCAGFFFARGGSGGEKVSVTPVQVPASQAVGR